MIESGLRQDRGTSSHKERIAEYAPIYMHSLHFVLNIDIL